MPDRRRVAIAHAALTLFASDGYKRTTVGAIAAEAGVSKRSVYTHFGGKENLFLSVVRDAATRMHARIGEIVEQTAWDRDLDAALTSCVAEVTRSIVRAPERMTLIRLLMAEAPHFPAIIDLLRAGEITPLIAVPLERLAAAGRLSVSDSQQAAEHLAALTFRQVSSRSLMGTLPLGDDETARLIAGGVQAFLRAYAPAAHGPGASGSAASRRAVSGSGATGAVGDDGAGMARSSRSGMAGRGGASTGAAHGAAGELPDHAAARKSRFLPA